MCRTVSHEEIFDIFDEEPPAPPSSDLTSSTSHQGPSITTHTNDNIENHGITLGTGIGLGIGIGITAGYPTGVFLRHQLARTTWIDLDLRAQQILSDHSKTRRNQLEELCFEINAFIFALYV
ncbi:unnamed protein product [Rotaria sp. Silwood1]|nr:unnamed protein product [Rotaria sp. Silwood1]